jgi:hypothetical protein
MNRSFSGLAAMLGVIVATACSDSESSQFGPGDGSAGTLNVGAGGNPIINLGDASIGPQDDGATQFGPSPVIPCNGPCTDFPATPILAATDGGAMGDLPADIADRFGPAGSGDTAGGPCLTEPEAGSLFPRNWLRPRFRVVADGSLNAFEIRIHSDKEANDLVVYTQSPTWYMPRDMWKAISSHVGEEWDFTVSIRGLNLNAMGSPPKRSQDAKITIAPAEADGSIVYWTTSGTPSLKGFAVGDENVVTTLVPSQVKQKDTNCLGCHTSTPDGKYAGFTIQGPWTNALGSLEAATVGETPMFLGAGAITALNQPELGIETFSRAHWANGDHIELTSLGAREKSQLTWIDLEAATPEEGTAYGTLARTGDSRAAGVPTWSHDGSTIVYVSTNTMTTGRLDNGEADLYSVPYNAKAGGMATPISGASDPALEEYYPTYSNDDKILAFDRIPSNNTMYDAGLAEVFVIPPSGGTATRLNANDPPACTNKKSPGITNSWPKWSPEAQTIGGKTYYWLIFSSRRSEGNRPQLYVTGIVTTPNGGEPANYAALYLWNQPEQESNHTPAWDVFKIPPTPPPADVH